MSGRENKGIFSMSADGTDVTQVTSGHFDRQPTWSPDGQRIAFVRENLDGGSDIFIVNADGSGAKQLTTGSIRPADPTWSPDGRTIAFAVTTASRICTDYDYGPDYTYPCGYEVERVDLNGVIDPKWSIGLAFNPAWQR